MEFMMTQTKHKIFNKKIKMLLLLLLILICALIRCGCVGNATEQHAAGSFIALKTQAAAEMLSVDAAAASSIDGQNSDEAASIRSTAIYERNSDNHNKSEDDNSDNHSDVDNSAEDQQDNNLQDNAEQTTLKNQLNNNNDNDNNNNNNNSNNNNKGKRIGNLMIRKNSTKIYVADDAVDINEGDAVDDRDVDGVIRKGTSTVIRRRRGRQTRTSRASTSLQNDAVINTENNVIERRFDVDVVDDARDEARDGIAATTTAPEMTMAMLKQKLLYDLAIKRKQIPRMTYFTCNQNDDDGNTNENNNNNGIANTKTANNRKMRTLELMQLLYSSKTAASVADDGPSINNSNNGNNNNNNINNNSNNSIPRIYPKDVFIKVVRIDQLINKQRGGSNRNSNNNHHHHSNKQRSGVSKDAPNHNLNVFAEGRNAEYSFDSNWIQDMLSPERLRQMVVLDLGCGAASRKVIETASNNGFFNAAYHWLLIDEDYVLNRQTPINGNNNKNNNNNNNNDNNNNDNNNNDNNYDDDTDADVDNRINKNVNLKKRIDFKTVANRFAAKLSESKSKALDRNPQQELQQQQQQKSFATDGVAEDEEDEDEDEEENVANMKNMKIIEKFLEKINININTELILAKLTLRGGSTDVKHTILQKKDYFYTLRDVWNPGRQYGGQLNITEIGNFSLDGGLQLVPGYRRSTTITQRVDMKKARIRCLIVITHKNRTDTLEHYLTTRYDTHLDSMHRFNFALLTHIRDLYNFSFVLSETASWGYLTNGTFDGMIGALTRKEADIGGSPIFFRLERAKVIDYTARTWVARPCFIFRHPRTSKNDRIVFLQPFSNDIWILTAVCGTITVLFLWTLSSLERRMSLAGVHGDASPPLMIQKNSMASTTTGAKTTTTKPTVSSSLQAARNSTTTATGQKSSNHNNSNSKSSIAAGISKTTGSQQAAASAGGHPFKQHCVRWCTTLCGHSGDDAARRRVGLFFESVLLYVGLICQQGLAYSTKFFSGRCVIATSLFFSFAIYQFYSASIVGTLLMDKPNTIRTLRDLIHSSLEIGIEDILYNRDFFVRTTDPDALELYAKKVTAVRTSLDPANSVEVLSGRDFMRSESSNWYDPDFGVAKVRKGGFAFHVDVATAYKIISESFSEKEICDLSEIQLFPPQKMVSIVQKGSPLRKVMTYGFRRATEAGLTDYQRKVWHSPKPHCIKRIHTDDLKVDMQTFSSAFLMLIYGFAVSLLTLGFEILHHNLWQRLAGLQVA